MSVAEGLADVKAIYSKRFNDAGLERRDRVWRVLCQNFFNRYFKAEGSVLDLACGYGEFINNVDVLNKHAVDMNPDAARHLLPNVDFKVTPAGDLGHLQTGSIDRVFTSNFLEHLPNKAACDDVLKEVLRVLRPGGRFVILGPNIRYAFKQYWDFYDHYLPLSHRSLAEGLAMNGFDVTEVIDRFLPFTMAGKQPTSEALIKLYLRARPVWKIVGKQFLVTAQKPSTFHP